jgi:hypothetical protein
MLLIDLGHWVKPRNTTWFSRLLLIEFDDNKWVESFCMNKSSLFNFVECMRLVLQKQKQKYCKMIVI